MIAYNRNTIRILVPVLALLRLRYVCKPRPNQVSVEYAAQAEATDARDRKSESEINGGSDDHWFRLGLLTH